MALFNYKNIEEIISTKGPTRGVRLVDSAQSRRIVPRFEKIDPNTVERLTGGFESVEMHAFSSNNLYVTSVYDLKTWTIDNTQETNSRQLKLDIHKDIDNLKLGPSSYRFVYNFFRNFIGSAYDSKLFISEISADRTELKLSLSEPENPIMLEQLKSFVLDYLAPKKYLPPIILNFGENQIISVVNLTSDGSTTNFFVKLYEPLPDVLDLYYECWVASEILKPYIELVSIEQKEPEQNLIKISGPNFDVDMDYWIVSETDYKSWSDLLSTNVQTSQEILNRYVFDSGSTVKLNIDFSEFSNFIFYSSAEERVKNFVYKVGLIQSYNEQLNVLNTYTGSFTGSLSNGVWNYSNNITGSYSGSYSNNKVKIKNLKDKVISGFDEFEKWMYNETTSSYNYTFQNTASVSPYPKYEYTGSDYDLVTKEGKYKLYKSIDDEFVDWYNDILDKATDYDLKNYNALNKAIPETISLDDENVAFVSFINMIGQHFDIMYLYTDHITQKNKRIENPKDGLSQDLVYQVAKNLGWTLSHGTQAKDLWEYALGVSGSGDPVWTGKTLTNRYDTLTDEERTKEVWRRILNNLPYIYKTKGTARGIMALLSAYGIPKTILQIREYGGPDISDFGITPRANFEKATYYLNMSGTYPLPTRQHYVSVPWERVNNDVGGWSYPDTVTLRWKMETDKIYGYGNDPQQTILQKNSGSNVDWFVIVSKDQTVEEKGSIHFYLGNGTGYATASITDQYLYDDTPLNLMIRRSFRNDATSSNQIYDVILKTGKYGKIAIESSASIVVSGSVSGSYNQRWSRDGVLYVGSGSNSETNNILSGSLFELRYWSRPLSTSSFDNHVLSARSYNGNTTTSSFYDLQGQWKFWQKFDAENTQSLISTHPNQKNNTFYSSSKNATLYGFNSSSFEPTNEVYRMEVATVAGDTPFAEKTRIDSGSLYAGLHPTVSTEVSVFDDAVVDSNKLMVAFSPQHIINEDIYEAIGYTAIDDYFGYYDDMYKDEYPRLKWFANEYWKKYPNKNDFTAYINLISIYDFSIFEQIRQTLPARVNPILGLAIEPNVLERSKVVALKGIRGENTDKFVKETNDISKLPKPSGELSNKKTVILVGFDDEKIDLDKLTLSDDIDLKFEIGGIASDEAEGDFNVPINTSIINNNANITKVENIKLTPRTNFISQNYTTIIYETKQELSVLNNQYKTQMRFGLDKVSSVVNPSYSSSLYTDFDVSYNWENVYFDETLNEDIGYGYGWNYYPNSIGTKTAVINQIGNFRDEGFYQSYYFTYSSGNNLAEGIFDTYELTGSKYMNPHNNITSARNRNFDGCKNSSPDINVRDNNKPGISQPTVTVNLRCPRRPCPI
jgi:hypothetical protein